MSPTYPDFQKPLELLLKQFVQSCYLDTGLVCMVEQPSDTRAQVNRGSGVLLPTHLAKSLKNSPEVGAWFLATDCRVRLGKWDQYTQRNNSLPQQKIEVK